MMRQVDECHLDEILAKRTCLMTVDKSGLSKCHLEAKRAKKECETAKFKETGEIILLEEDWLEKMFDNN